MAPVKKPKPLLQPHFMGQWREYRRMSQEDAAELMGISRTLLSKIEGAKSPWGQPILQNATKVYHCTIAGLLTINPLADPDAADLGLPSVRALWYGITTLLVERPPQSSTNRPQISPRFIAGGFAFLRPDSRFVKYFVHGIHFPVDRHVNVMHCLVIETEGSPNDRERHILG